MQVNPKDFEIEFSKNLQDYANDIIDEVKELAKKSAESCLKKIKSRAPVRTGNYKKSWKIKKTIDDACKIEYVVYSSKYNLTHLLEYGHQIMRKKDGTYVSIGVSKAKPHIRPSTEEANNEFLEGIKKVVR